MSGISANSRIDSFQALRALAFGGIFFYHTHFLVSWPFLGVSTFFIMSGFLMMHVYDGRELTLTFRDNLEFSVRKIKRLYPLHIITMLFAMVVYFVIMLQEGIGFKVIIAYVGKVLLNIFLLESWFPDSSVCASMNGVAWYLSVMVFLYFIFPWLRRFIKKTKLSTLGVLAVIFWCTEFVLCLIFVTILGDDSKVYMWFAYMFPIVRLEDFFIGCILKRFCYERKLQNFSTFKASVLELVTVTLSCVAFLFGRANHDSILEQVLSNWTLIHIPLAAMWVLVFAINKGIITKLFVNKILIAIGNADLKF